jgi:hypothetical protein
MAVYSFIRQAPFTLCVTLLSIASALGVVPACAQESQLTAIDIALRPDATMCKKAIAANSRLLKDYPQGFALDASHNPHITVLQRYVKTDDLNKVYEVARQVVVKEQPTHWKLLAFKYYYGKGEKTGLAGIVVKPSPDLLRLQKELIDALAPYSVPEGTSAAFITTPDEPNINTFTIEFVSSYIEKASGDKFNPHVTTGIGTIAYLDKLLAEPFKPFAFKPAEVCIYQLGDNGTARKKLKSLSN